MAGFEAAPHDLLTGWRRHLHAHPELSLQERDTADFVCRRLAEMEIPFTADVGGHGVVATLVRGEGRAVGLRADMDALPIQEQSKIAYASNNPGVMHACGHDGHTASLLGAALHLRENQDWRGTIRLIFQPAEEGHGGAAAMLEDGLLSRFPLERIFAYHNWPGLEEGMVAVHDKAVMAASYNFEILLQGRAAHGAMPHLARDPVSGLAQLILALNSIVSRDLDPLAPAALSICQVHGGSTHNQIPDSMKLVGTFRAFDAALMNAIAARIEQAANGAAALHGLRAETRIYGYLAPTCNSEAAIARQAAGAAGLTLADNLPPSMAAEDFGTLLEQIPGAYVWIGNGPGSGLHSPDYDFNDRILEPAACYLAAVAQAALEAA